MHIWEKFWTNAIKRPKKKKNQLPLLKSLEQKQGTVYASCIHHLTNKPPKLPLCPTPRHTPTLTPFKEQGHPSQ